MKRLVLLSLLSAFSMSAFADQIYIMHDNNCMDRLTYKIKYFNGSKLDVTANSLSFKVQGAEHESVVLNIGEENDELSKTEPKILNCEDVHFNEEFVKKINSYASEVFIVKKVGKKYRISPVQSADYFYSSSEELAYGDIDFGFNYNYIIGDQKTNLLSYGVKSKVNYNFRDDQSCPSEYHFKKLSKQKNDHNLGLVILPDLGLIKKNYVDKKSQKLVKQYVLSSINKVELVTFMDIMCNGQEEEIIKVVEAEKAPVEKKKATLKPETEVKDEAVLAEAKSVLKKEEPIKKKEIVVAGLEKAVPAEEVKKAVLNPSEIEEKSEGGEIVMTMIPVIKAEDCSHIYKDLDKGLYMDRNTGKPAEGDCGGFAYAKGLVQGEEEGTLVENTQSKEEPAEEEAKVVYKEAEPKIVYKEPKIIYKEADPIVITKSVATTSSLEVDCGALADENHHLIKKGETLYRISKMYNVDIRDIKKWNSLGASDIIQTCTMLRIKKPLFDANIPSSDLVSKGASPKTQNTQEYHFVQKGETLYSISKNHGLSVDMLKQYNGLLENTIKPGWRLKLKAEQIKQKEMTPPAAEKIAPAAEKITPQPNKTAVLKQEIAPIEATTSPKGGEVTAAQPVEKLPNNLVIKENTIISNTSYTMHTVSDSETIESIAQKYNTTVEEIRKVNNMEEGEVLIPYQKIKIK